MVQDFATELVTIFCEVFEGVLMALVGVTPPKRHRRAVRTAQTAHTVRPQSRRARHVNSTLNQGRIVLSERAWLRMSHELAEALPHDEAISVLNTIQRYAANV